MGVHWILGQGDVVEWRGLSTMEGLFNVALLPFVDAETGEQRSVTASEDESRARVGTLVRIIRAGRPLTEAQAQGIADRAIAVLGGGQPARWFLTVKADREVQQAGGAMRPATEIRDLDTVELDIPGSGTDGALSVQILGRDEAAGTILLEATDGPLDGRLEMQLELTNLARGD